MGTADEPELLQRLLGNEPAAWREIVGRYSGLLLAISRRTFLSYGFLPASQDCEDAVAEVWRNLLDQERAIVRRCLERGHFLPTLQVLARNRTIDVLRRRRIVTVPLEEGEVAVPLPDPEIHFPRELTDLIPKALAVLSSKERTLVELFFLQGKKYREIEVLVGIPQNSIGPTLGRALVKLRKAMAGAVEELGGL